MFEERYERNTSGLAWTLSAIVLVASAVSGWWLFSNLRQSEAQLTQASDELQAERSRVEIEQSAAERAAQQLAACKADTGTCTASLATAQARVKELEAAHAARRR